MGSRDLNILDLEGVNDVLADIALIEAASCSCGSKSPDWSLHREECNFHRLGRVRALIAILQEKAFGSPVIREGEERDVFRRFVVNEKHTTYLIAAMDLGIKTARKRSEDLKHVAHNATQMISFDGVTLDRSDLMVLHEKADAHATRLEAARKAFGETLG